MLTFHITLCARQEAKYSRDSSLPLHEETSKKERIKVPQPPLGVQNWWPGVILRSSSMSHIGPPWSPTPCKENRSLFSPITIQPSSETPPMVGVQFSWSSTMLSLEVIEKSLWVTSSPTGSRPPSIIGRLDQEAAKWNWISVFRSKPKWFPRPD